MDPTIISAFVDSLQGTGLAPLVAYVPIVVASSAILAAILPTPAADSKWMPLRKLLDLLALNVGAAKNQPKV